MTLGADWSQYGGIVLLNHGLFTFADSAQESYENHIKLVTMAEQYIKRAVKKDFMFSVIARSAFGRRGNLLLELAQLRQSVSRVQGGAVVALLKDDKQSIAF